MNRDRDSHDQRRGSGASRGGKDENPSPSDGVTSIDTAERAVMTPQAWERLCDVMRDAGRFVYADGVPSSPADRAEGLRYLTRLIASGINVCMELGDGEAPRFGRMIDCTMKWGLDAPDCLYLYSSVCGDAVYRIHGRLGTANHVDVQVNYGHYAAGDISQWGTVSSLNSRDLATGPDGEVEILLGGKPRDRNWLALAPNAEFVLVRQYFGDWNHEQPADLYIERLDGLDVPEPVPTPDAIAARLERLAGWIERGGSLWESMSRGFLDLEPNSLIFHDTNASDAHGGMQGQAYGLGNFRCAPDEAVIVEFAVPDCPHWSVSLADWYWQSFDYATRQSSLNCRQAVVDDDGVFRAVIAHRDPGVANWLDAAGHEQGTIAIRFLLADRAAPPTLRRVALEQVAQALPASTARVTAQERLRTIAERRAAVLRRFRR